MTKDEIDDALESIISYLARTRDIKGRVERARDVAFCRKYFEDIDDDLVADWTAIVLVNVAHNMPTEAIKSLMITAATRRSKTEGEMIRVE